jgi:hypothetical protein
VGALYQRLNPACGVASSLSHSLRTDDRVNDSPLAACPALNSGRQGSYDFGLSFSHLMIIQTYSVISGLVAESWFSFVIMHTVRAGGCLSPGRPALGRSNSCIQGHDSVGIEYASHKRITVHCELTEKGFH